MSSGTSTYHGRFEEAERNFANLVELLQARAARHPERLAFTFLRDGEGEESHLTYWELERQARAIGAWLQGLNLRGERVLLLYPPGLEYVAAFWGCLYAGAVAVPAYPPRLNRHTERLQAVVADARAAAALTTANVFSRLKPLLGEVPGLGALRWVQTEEVEVGAALHWREPEADSSTLAFLQYTSGSTATPKGVMVSHGNLLHNEGLIKRAFAQDTESVIVGWLPLYHDMGLIGNVLQPLYVGGRCVLMSPNAFLQRPVRWLEAITRYRATTSGGPNFAYDLCVRRTGAEERARLDLSSWSVAFNGAEPIHAATLERFAEAFEPCGFRREAFYPCYGLAEATLLVSGKQASGPPAVRTFEKAALEGGRVRPRAERDERGRVLVGCGGALDEQQILVVNPESLTACAGDEVGEIWVSGPSVARGYWNRDEEAAGAFGAYLTDTGRGPFLRTGDLGFVSDGELFITGRLKDLLIIRGRNIYPHDVERTAEASHPALRPGGGVVFSVEAHGEERLVAVHEVDHRAMRDPSEVIAAVRQAVAEEHEAQTHAVLLVKAGGVPRTSSGKLQRRLARQMFLSAQFTPLAEWRADGEAAARPSAPADDGDAGGPLESPEEIADFIRGQLASKLGVEAASIGAEQPVTRYGVDSLVAVELAHALESRLGVSMPAVGFLQDLSIRELAEEARRRLTGREAARDGSADSTDGASYELSYGQQALWFLHRMAPDSAVYNVAAAVRVQSELDAGALRRAFEALAARHPALRTTFATEGGAPVQRVREDAPPDFAEVDGASWGARDVDGWLAEEARRPFRLDEGSLLRVRLLLREGVGHVLLMVAHHIVVDFWSLAIMLQEVGLLYEAERRGAPADLAPPRASYADYVRRQAQLLEGAEGERLWQYWQRRLGTPPPALNLPHDRPRPPVQTYLGASHAFRLDEELTRGLKALAREGGATLYMVLLAAFEALLHRYTSQEDFAVGSPSAGRDAAVFSRVVGYFVNPLVMRADLSGDPTFEELRERVRRTVLEAYAHQDYPFALLVQRLQPERDASRSPLFQAMFVLQQARLLKDEGIASLALGEEGARARLGGLALESVSLAQRVAQFDLKLSAAEADGALLASFEYNTDLFDARTVERMAAHFETLLRGVVEDPRRRLSALPLLSPAEEHRLLVEWNDTRALYPRDVPLHQLIEEQAERTPDALAVVSDEGQLTYRELNRRANQLAHHLRGLGVGPEALVGVLLERSVELVVALLGVLKAGAAYVPLDPGYPPQRLAFMLEDARLPVLLAQQRLLGVLPGHGARVVRLDADWEQIAREPADNPAVELSGANLAYMIYTSGSTGRPKGAMNTHGGIVNRLVWMQDAYRLSPSDAVLQKTPLSFDVSVWEFFWPLLAGARLVMARPGGHQDAAYLASVIEEQRITTLHFVPSMLHAFLARADAARAASLKRVICSGEALSYELKERFYSLLPEVELHNLYGPTEAAVDVTYWACERDGGRRVVPIGRPIANTQIYVLSKELRPVPVGVAGELYIGGDGLARGYLRRPGLTAERFVPDPFSAEPGARLYRTGDLARHLPGGEVEFLGRVDHQVKVRGFRIELGEIEAALAEHESVSECVVVAREDAPGDARLVAYVVTGGRTGTSASAWRRFLGERLPEYMIPSAFVALEAMPLLPNGKVDRGALPAPQGARPELEEAFAAPRDQIEEVIADVWAGVLGLSRVGVNDNFFELGGHSLIATQVVSRLNEAFHVDLPLRLMFEAPTVAGLAERVSHAAGSVDAAAAAAGPIERAPRGGPLPLSLVQQRLWFLDQLEPGNTAYNIPLAIRLAGRLEINTLESCVQEIVRRHEALRTTFKLVDGEPAQFINPPGPWRLAVIDLRNLPEDAREAEALRLAVEEARTPFDLAEGPLLRAALMRLRDDEHVLTLTMHHIVSDGWSIGVFVRELTALYEAFSAAEPSPLAELPVQYADFAQWQRARLAGRLLDEQLAYWRRQLGGALPVVELPSEKTRPPKATYNGANEPWSLPAELAERLKALGRERGATLFMTLTAAFQTLLHRYTGLEDVVIGAPVAGRTRVEAENLIGFFANTLVLRTDFSGDPRFEDLLGRVREVTLEAHAHQDVSFEMLVEELQPARDLGHTPLFQVMLAMQNAPLPEMRLRGLKVSQVEVDTGTAKFDLIFFVREAGGGLAGSWEYNSDALDRASVRRMMAHFETLLRGVVEDPGRRLSALPLLSPAEERRLLVEWNDTRALYPRGESLHQLFEAQAKLTPNSIAIIYEHERWTYRELNRRANQLAHHLRGLGVGPEALVGVLLERSVELVVALLGVLKAGAAYVPLDPDYPPQRLAFMLEDTRAPVLLTQARLLEQAPAGHGARVVRLDADWEQIAAHSEEDPGDGASPENLAYMIYTSGSTGRPKGVAIEHHSAVTLVHWARDNFDPESLRGVLASTSVCFDLSVFEIFVPLSCGGAVIMAANALALPELPAASEVTLVNTVPSAMAELLRLEGMPASVRTVNLAGEALQNALVQRVYEKSGVGRVVNLYGPSEDTTYSTWAVIERGRDGVPPIGRPVSNTRVYIVDGVGSPAPVGVAGELYIGGDGLARGYLNRPALTAERFVPDPFSGEPGARLYRTGDLARYLSSGEIEFLGRVDHQVKVRGFRIELGEIEAALAEQPEVQESVVVARGRGDSAPLLVSYIVTRPGFAPTSGELRRRLKEQLPEYMIPSAFVILDEMPLTPNGKVNRAALPEPEQTLADAESAYLAPRTPVEEELADIWAGMLGLARVGVHDNFFDLGGHSLVATQVVSRVRQAFHLELPLRALFEAPTVAELAAHVELMLRASEVIVTAEDEGGEPPAPLASEGFEGEELVRRVEMLRQAMQEFMAPPILPVEREGPLPLSFAQQRLWFLHQLAPGSSAYNILGGMRFEGALDVAALGQAVNEIAGRHEALRTTFTTVDGQPVQVVSAVQPVPLTLIDLRPLPEDESAAKVRALAHEELKRPFDLTHGPLLRVSLLRLKDDEHVALLTMHHIVSDGWSTAIFVKEFAAFYESLLAGRAPALAPLPVQYADYAHWQREWLQGEVLESHLAYWKRTLGGALPTLTLPADRPRPEEPTLGGAKFFHKLPAGLYRRLAALSRREGVTLYMTLLAAFKTLLYGYTKQEDMVVGTAIAGRNRAEIEDLIGVFINMLVLRTDLSGNPTFRELLKRVQEVTLEAYMHQEVPFEKLVEELQPARALTQSPLFQVAFGLQHAPLRSFKLPGLSLSPLAFEADISRYDLTLWMLEGEGELTAAWTYSTDLFEAETIRRMQGRFETVLRSVVADPEARLASLDMLSEEERREAAARQSEWEEASVKKLMSVRRQPVKRPAGGAS
ncbi:MAG TPA: amino acid adenylation domain-containing protein [Pyrinomonadaceae bacterium]|jgi:amino acid adenylation domain-containing protein